MGAKPVVGAQHASLYLTRQLLSGLSPLEVEAAKVLAALNGTPADERFVATCLGCTEDAARGALEKLERRRLLTDDGLGLKAAEPGALRQATGGGPAWTDAALERLVGLGKSLSAADWTEQLPTFQALLRAGPASASGRSVGQLLALARVLGDAELGQRQWGAAERTFSTGLTLSRALEDRTAEGYFLHQLGTVALCRGEARAVSLLEQALAVRRELGDVDGAQVTAQNLALARTRRGPDTFG